MKILRALVFCLLISAVVSAQSPVLFFSDLTAGPATGNSDPTYSSNGGAYVTIYGNFLPGTLTTSNIALNGSNCLGIVSQPVAWMWYQKFTVQLHSGCASGNFTVTTSSGTSNGIAFTVQSENIYFASGSGNDSSGTGSWTAPWKTLLHAVQNMPGGSIVYGLTGSDATVDDGTGWSTTMLITRSGTATAPFSVIGYPGDTVQIGPTSGGDSSIRSGDVIPTNYWTFAELNIHAVSGETCAQWGSNFWRYVGNDETAPSANGEEGGCEPIDSTYTTMYGNNFHNMGVTGASAEFHGVYIATDASETDFGWNTIQFSNGGRCLQTHSEYNGPGTNGYTIYNVNIHDNYIHDCGSDCLVLDTVSPGGNGSSNPQGGPLSGPVTVYNNVMYNCGLVTPPEDTGDWSGIEIPGTSTTGPSPTGTIYTFNNTFYNYGVNASPPYGDAEYGIVWNGPDGPVFDISDNNLMYSTQGTRVPYYGGNGGITGANNWMYNGPSTSGASTVTGTIGTNPQLSSVTTANFTPLSGSPVLGAGLAMTGTVTPFGANTVAYDINGLLRPSPPAIGALELSGSVSPTPTVSLSPTSLTFAAQAIGTTTASQTITLTNTGTATLTITSITLSGTNSADFAIPSATNTCGASLAVNASCTLGVTFTPSLVGTESASIVFTTNAPTSPNSLSLSGTGALSNVISGIGIISGVGTIKP
jgi:hypothetical protein